MTELVVRAIRCDALDGSRRRTKVAFLVPNLQGGGAERVFVTLIRHLDRTRYEPHLVLGKREGTYLEDLPDDLGVTELGGLRARNVLGSLPRWVRSVRPELVLATSGFAVAAALTRHAWPARTMLVSRLANTLSSFYEDIARRSPRRATLYRWLNRVTYLRSDAVVCQCDFMLADAEREIGFGNAKLHRIYNPVDVDYVRSRSYQGSQVLYGSGPHLVAVGNLHWRKGYDTLIRAMAIVHARRPNVTLTILGEGEQRHALELLIAELGLQETIRLPGFAENPHAVLRAADLMVSSSRYEGFANVIVESLAIGTPIVATDCPGANREVMRHGVGGRLARPGDPSALAAQIQLSLESLAELRRSVSELRVSERFGVEASVRHYEELFERLSRQPG